MAGIIKIYFNKMATLTKNANGEYQVVPGDTLTKIASTQGRTLAELLAQNPQYASNPNLIKPGDVVKFGNNAEPSYSALTAGQFNNSAPIPSTSTVPSPVPSPYVSQNTTDPKTNFTKALIDILKNAQQQSQAGQAKLMLQGQNVIGKGLADSARIFSNPELTPSAGTSLGLSAQNQFEPLTLSIENQQKLATQNLGNLKDIISMTKDDFERQLDNARQEAVLQETIRHNKASENLGNKKYSDMGVYVEGENPSVDAWVKQINSGASKMSDVPANLKSLVAQGLSSGTQQASNLIQDAYSSANDLLNSFNKGNTYAVGKSSILPIVPGTDAANFVRNIDNLKSLLSLDNVKYLKGQGQVSDAERKLLADASTQLDRSQSETQFKATLQKIVNTLGNKVNPNTSSTQSGGTIKMSGPGGTFNVAPENIDKFISNGYTKI